MESNLLDYLRDQLGDVLNKMGSIDKDLLNQFVGWRVDPCWDFEVGVQDLLYKYPQGIAAQAVRLQKYIWELEKLYDDQRLAKRYKLLKSWLGEVEE